MVFRFNHVHLKAPDPKETAEWYVKAFNFKIVRDEVRESGDRFLRCQSEDGIVFNISAARTGEQMGEGDAAAHWGLEHFGVDSDDIQADLERLGKLGAKLLEGPRHNPANGNTIAFIQGPNDVRIELIQPAKR